MGKTISFQPQNFEPRWQKVWEEKGIYQPDLKNAKRPFYNLMMFPYPSAEGLHVGNMYAFTGADIYGRFKRMQGYDVFEPIGLDGFGIHSENYALKIGRHPAKQAKISEKNFYRQLQSIGNGFAWRNRLETYDPSYYRFTQWLFLKMFKAGLAYRKKSPVNFCPSCRTVLADEQVIAGSCERCKTLVEKKEMEQWFFKITAYAERLLENTYRKDFFWTEKVKIGQRNWIGKKEGINITYPVIDGEGKPLKIGRESLTITCFTTRPDTNFGATFVVVAPEHPFATLLSKANSQFSISDSKLKEIKNYLEKAKAKSEAERMAEGREKTGVFTGFYALNQLTNYKMPIWISDFVLGYVGTGAVVGVPGHDKRDFQFAQKFDLPIIRVVVGKDGDTSPIVKEEQVQEEEGKMINSGFLNGMEIKKAISAMMDYLEKKGWGKRVTVYKLRDWCISRQRYWGAPIPMIFCPHCAEKGQSWFTTKEGEKLASSLGKEMPGWYPVREEDLPVLLPLDVKDWKPEGTGKGPLAKISSFVKTKCPACGKDAERETDVCDTFLDSSWYFLRYPSKNYNLPWDPEITQKWLPVNQYIGGAEHTVLHLLYSRFVTMALKDLGYLSFEEPFSHFFAHGLIIAEGAKMSKSRGNVVIPDLYIKKYGADTLRSYLMFLGPFNQGGDFRDSGLLGMFRFLKRVWRLVEKEREKEKDGKREVGGLDEEKEWKKVMHKTIKAVTLDLENFRYNTALAHLMSYLNFLEDFAKKTCRLPFEVLKNLLLLLAPFAPYMTEELWQRWQRKGKGFSSIHLHPWPSFEEKYLFEEEIPIIIQVNGKTREIVKISPEKGKDQQAVAFLAKESAKVKKYLQGKNIRREVFVPGRLLNFVTSP